LIATSVEAYSVFLHVLKNLPLMLTAFSHVNVVYILYSVDASCKHIIYILLLKFFYLVIFLDIWKLPMTKLLLINNRMKDNVIKLLKSHLFPFLSTCRTRHRSQVSSLFIASKKKIFFFMIAKRFLRSHQKIF